jgi:molybdopterin molybdotransferase
MISIDQALKIVKENTPRLSSEIVPLEQVVNRVLAENVAADMDMPPFHRSQMDGYAVQASDTRRAPVRLKIVGESAAGKSWSGTLKRGEAVRIMTGAAVPKGANAVQKLELTNEANDFVEILEPANKGQNIVPQAAEIRRGETIFSAGEIINQNMIATFAAFGFANVRVAKRPRTAIMATGNEIVDFDKTPGKDQIRNSNSPMLKVYAEQAGATCDVLPSAGDEIENLKAKIASQSADVFILTGGVSVGKYDLTKAALRELGAKILFEKVALRPGKPTVFGLLDDCLIFALPGNPVSAAVTFQLFVRPALFAMQGANEIKPKTAQAVLAAALKGTKERDSYIPVRLTFDKRGILIAEPLKWGGSSDFVSFARADALAFVPAARALKAGDTTQIVLIPSCH